MAQTVEAMYNTVVYTLGWTFESAGFKISCICLLHPETEYNLAQALSHLNSCLFPFDLLAYTLRNHACVCEALYVSRRRPPLSLSTLPSRSRDKSKPSMAIPVLSS